MDIQKLDKNFAVQTADDGSQKDLYTIPRAPFSLYGVTFSESEGRFVRMPHTVAANVSEGVKNLALHTAGCGLQQTRRLSKYTFRTLHSPACRIWRM